VAGVLAEALGAEAGAVASAGRFEVGGGRFAGSYCVCEVVPYEGALTVDNLRAFQTGCARLMRRAWS
jgi:hypothetical protein